MKNEVANAPEYVTADTKEREEFLSQHGNFTPGEREIFHFLCGQWQPEIPYRRISSGANLGLGNKKGEFLGLMAKLRKGRVGVLRTSLENGRRTESFVVLTREGDIRFYAHLLDEESDRLAEEIPGMPPIEKIIAGRGVEIPDRHVRSFSYDEVVAAVDGRMAAPRLVVRLPAAAGQAILLSPISLAAYPDRSRESLRMLLADTQLLSAVAKACDSGVGKLKTVLESDHAGGWAGLTKCIFDARKVLETSETVTVPKALYAAAAVVHRISASRVSLDRERIKQEKERLQNLEIIAAELRSGSQRVLKQPELDEILEGYRAKYGTEFEEFRNEFYTRYTTPKERRNLAAIQPLGTSYVHRDNLYQVFLDRFQDAQAVLYTYYLGLMGEFIRSRDTREAFSSYQGFCNDIRARVPKVDEILGELFMKPFLLAEVIIYGEKKRRNVSSIDEVRTILARFFVSDQMELRDFAVIFELNMLELFETAHLQLPLLLQIWHKITGKYESLRETVKRRSGGRLPGFRVPEPESGGSEPSRPRDEVGPQRRGGSVVTTRRRRTRADQPQKAKYYTRKDQERAWQEFSQALKQ